MSTKSERIYWRSRNLCMECGGEIDKPKKFVRCASCREAVRRQKSYKANHGDGRFEQTVAQLQSEDKPTTPSKVDQCVSCIWGSLAGNTVVCSLPYCCKEANA